MSVFFLFLTTRCTHFICNFTIIAFCYLFISSKLKFPSGSGYKAVFVCSEIITHDFTFSVPLGVCQECFIQKRGMNTVALLSLHQCFFAPLLLCNNVKCWHNMIQIGFNNKVFCSECTDVTTVLLMLAAELTLTLSFYFLLQSKKKIHIIILHSCFHMNSTQFVTLYKLK